MRFQVSRVMDTIELRLTARDRSAYAAGIIGAAPIDHEGATFGGVAPDAALLSRYFSRQ